jgi:hypothetical protein
VLKSAKQNGNKQIADFNLRKSAAIFANELREGQKIAAVGKIVPTSGGGKPPPYNVCAGGRKNVTAGQFTDAQCAPLQSIATP